MYLLPSHILLHGVAVWGWCKPTSACSLIRTRGRSMIFAITCHSRTLLLDLIWLILCNCQRSIGQSPQTTCLQLILSFAVISIFLEQLSCTWRLASCSSFSPDSFPGFSSLFLHGCVVSTVAPAWQCCHYFFLDVCPSQFHFFLAVAPVFFHSSLLVVRGAFKKFVDQHS